MYDLRYADRGSNVRSKGIDGFTPLGPALLDARDVDPENIRLRTWVNGEPVQDAVTGDDLLFSLADIVADISRLTTLEPGDVILTGTPSGSTVVRPGDLVEVEVSYGQQTTGRLRSPIEEADYTLSPPGAMPDADDAQRELAYGARGAPGPTDSPAELLAAVGDVAPRRSPPSCASAATTPSPWTGCTPPGRPRRWPDSPGRCGTCRSARTCSPSTGGH